MSTTPAVPDGRVPRIVPIFNGLAGRLMRAGLPMGPNVLLTVRGRTSGLPRTFPVALLGSAGRIYVQSPYGEVNWVRNLRAAGEGVLARGRRRDEVDAVELSPDEGGPILRDALAPYMRGRLTARFVRVFVPLGRHASVEDYIEHVRAHPMFELRPRGGPTDR
jgi:deazaflavin-dependent oxidoreductase (nitroreductase family)